MSAYANFEALEAVVALSFDESDLALRSFFLRSDLGYNSAIRQLHLDELLTITAIHVRWFKGVASSTAKAS